MLDLFETGSHYNIVIELCSGGDLYDYLERRSFKIGEKRAWELASQLAGAIFYLHSFNIVHRDLKLENVMMTDDSEQSIPKVVDFGLSAMVNPGDGVGESVGTVAYAAPEIFKGEQYSKEVDIWSLGTMFFGCIGGYLPFDSPEKNKIMDRVLNEPLNLNHERWKKVSAPAKKLLQRMLEKDKLKRATILEVVESEWIKEGVK